MMTDRQNSSLSFDRLKPGTSSGSSWYGEYGTANRQDGEESKHAEYRSLANTLTQREPEYLYKRLEAAKKHMASVKSTVAMVRDDDDARASLNNSENNSNTVLTSKNSNNPKTGVSSGFVIHDKEGAPLLNVGRRSRQHGEGMGDVFRRVGQYSKKLQGPQLQESKARKPSVDDSKVNPNKVKMKLPIVSSKDKPTDRLDASKSGSSSGKLTPKTSTLSDSRPPSFLLPSLPSKHKQQPQPVTKPWRKRVTVSWSEGCASRVRIEELTVHRAKSDISVMRETKRTLTREHLRRFIIKERK